MEICYEQSDLLQDLMGAEHLKFIVLKLLQKRGPDFWDKGAEPYEIRLNLIQHLCGFKRMRSCPVLAAYSQDDVHAEFHSSFHYPFSSLNLLEAVCAFPDTLQHHIIPGLQSCMDSCQTGLGQASEVFRSFFVDELRRAINGNPFQVGKHLSGEAAYFTEVICFHGNGVSRRKKQGPDMFPVNFPRFQNVFLYLRRFSYLKLGTVFVDHAESAFVVGTPRGGLNQQRICLTGRAIYGAFVAHKTTLILLSGDLPVGVLRFDKNCQLFDNAFSPVINGHLFQDSDHKRYRRRLQAYILI